MQSKTDTPSISERLNKVLEDLELITRLVEESERPSNDNADDFLMR